MRSFYYFVFGIGSPMSVVKPLLWLLEPYIVYKAYLWALRFIAHPVTWEGEIDLFSLTLTVLLILDAVALPLVILYCPGLNPRKRMPDWIVRLGTPIYIVHNWLDGKVGRRYVYTDCMAPQNLAFSIVIHLLSRAILRRRSSCDGPRGGAHV